MLTDEWITTDEAANITNYHVNHIRRLIRFGKVRAKRFGPVWAIERQSLLDYLKSAGGKGEKRGPKSFKE